jgi:hypothetical protein
MAKVLNRALKLCGQTEVIGSVAVSVLEFNGSDLITRFSAASAPTTADRFAVGCRAELTDGTIYINQGTSAAPSWIKVPTEDRSVVVTLTNAQIKALRAAPVTLVAAPGTGLVNVFVRATLKLVYGSNALTESTDNLAVKYTDGSGVAVSDTIEATNFITATASTYTSAVAVKDAIVAATGCDNKALVLHNTGDGEYGGNAGNDTTMKVTVFYRVISA